MMPVSSTHFESAVLVEHPFEPVFVIAGLAPIGEHEFTRAAGVVGVLPFDAAIALEQRHRAGNDARFAVVVAQHGVENGAVRGAIHAGAERAGGRAQAQLTDVEAVAEEPSGGRVAVRHNHFRKRPAIHDGPDLAAVLVPDGVEHRAFARVKGVTEAPLLPMHFAIFDLEAGAVRLRDNEWCGGRP
jgi:hypothetical protein